MNWQWAAMLPRSEAHATAALRCIPALEACERGDEFWLRGPILEDQIANQLRRLPGAWRFEVLDDQKLRPIGKRVPSARLPEGPWRPLADSFVMEVPHLPTGSHVEPSGRELTVERVAISIQRGGPLREPNLLLTSRDLWATYGATAPLARLERCQFAMDARGRCLIRGNPLPPIQGVFFVAEHGIAVPGGWQLQPKIDAAVVRQLLHLDTDDLALFDTDGAWELIRPADWAFAARSAIRLSCQHAPE